MAETQTDDSFSKKSTNQNPKTFNKKRKSKTEHKLLSWKSSLDIFSSCKDYHDSKTNKPKTQKERKNNKNTANRATTMEDFMHRAVSASSSFSSVNTSSSTFSSLYSLSSLSSSFSSLGGSFRAMQIRKLSGCSELNCNAIVGPVSWVSSPSLRASLSICDDCGEIFTKSESLELHQVNQHAVSELGLEDSSRNIVEIIFQSSWRKKQFPICKIDRILKIQNSKTTISKFEKYREMIKLKSLDQKRSNPRITADGNELLRFYGSTFSCKLGFDGTTNLCKYTHKCEICGIIKDGFRVDSQGKISTFSTSSGAHDDVACDEVAGGPRGSGGEKKAMLVCRVISGKVQRNFDGANLEDECDSVENLDELFVFNPMAILPCFVVVYSGY